MHDITLSDPSTSNLKTFFLLIVRKLRKEENKTFSITFLIERLATSLIVYSKVCFCINPASLISLQITVLMQSTLDGRFNFSLLIIYSLNSHKGEKILFVFTYVCLPGTCSCGLMCYSLVGRIISIAVFYMYSQADIFSGLYNT